MIRGAGIGGNAEARTAVVTGMRAVEVVVIGAGQAGLSAAYHLQHRGFGPLDPASGDTDARTFVVLDANSVAGGAWQHRWKTLTMQTVNGIYELPGAPVPPADPAAASRDVLPSYFAEYEHTFGIGVQRPVRVIAVQRAAEDTQSEAYGDRLLVTAERQRNSGILTTNAPQPPERITYAARYVINATGTWTSPYWPHYPGREQFAGRQLHVRDYVSADEFAGQRVVIVGGGISATQLLEEISRVADTFWVTRTPPVWVERFSEPEIIASLAQVEERTRQGLAPQSIVRVTGSHRTPWIERADERGVLVRHPMFERIEPKGVRMPDGTFEPADVILWATGFRAALNHLAPLGLRTPQGGMRVANGRSLDEPRLFVIGYGASQSTVGANRAGRDAARAIVKELETEGVGPLSVSGAH